MDHTDDSTSPGGTDADSVEATAERSDSAGDPTDEANGAANKRKRGSRGGQNRRPAGASGDMAEQVAAADRNDVELPARMSEGRPSVEASERGLVRKPKIGDTMPMPSSPPPGPTAHGDDALPKKRNRRGKGGGAGTDADRSPDAAARTKTRAKQDDGDRKKSRGGGRGGRTKGGTQQLDDAWLEQRRGRERNGKPIGRYFMCVQSRPGMAQVAVLEGRNLIEHYVSRPADDVAQIHGNIYIGRVQNVLPGMEAAFVDIATPKNAVLYRSDVQYDPADIEQKGSNARIEDLLKNKQLILCQVTKSPIAHKGARLTQEVSLPGRYVVLIPNSKTYGISKRLPDDVRKRLRGILDRVKPDEHGLIVRTAAESATEEELTADMILLLKEWEQIERKAAKAQRPALLYREPELAVRVIREEFNADYRGVIIDDKRLHEEVYDYVAAFNPDLADRIEYYDTEKRGCRCSNGTMCTSRSTRPSIARSGCRPAVR